jgi:endogenous inhibitor of DNA gyrase (YacG/DUF329 family)
MSASFTAPENAPRATSGPGSCPTCGRAVAPAVAGARGRPRLYCSERCQRIESLRASLEREVSSLVEDLRDGGLRPSPEVSRLRGALWRIGNLMNAVGIPARIACSARKTRTGWRGLRA